MQPKTKQPKITSVLFDLDGTLLDTAPDFVTAFNYLLKEEGLPKVNSNIDDFSVKVSRGSKKIILEHFDLKENDKKFERLFDRFLELYHSTNYINTNLFPGMLEIIQILEKNSINWGIVTNKLTWLTENIVKIKPYLQSVNVVVCGDTTKNPKPSPEPLLLAADKLKVEPNSCIFVGDHERDIIAGKAANMKTVTALFGYIPSKDEALKWNADFNANTVDELNTHLKSLIL